MRDYSPAKVIFDKYRGSKFHMAREGDYELYKSYCVPKRMEEKWFLELKSETRMTLTTEKSRASIVEAFSVYGDLVRETKDVSGMKFMMDFVESVCNEYDTYSVVRLTNDVLDSCKFLDKRKRNSYIRRTIELLKSLTSRKITISEEYKDDYTISQFITADGLYNDVLRTINYYEKDGGKDRGTVHPS